MADFAPGATIPGGNNNRATTECFAAGTLANAAHTGSFVWGDSSLSPTTTTEANQFVARASGGFTFYTATGTGGASLPAGSGAWNNMSDRNAKENFCPVDAVGVLSKVAAMPLTSWNYKTQERSIRHVGPMAQDFHEAFGMGQNDTSISTVGEGGVALAAIQGLNQVVSEKDAEIQDLQQRLATLEKIVQNLAPRN